MFITVWIVILPFDDKFLFILIYPLTFKEIQTISQLHAWIWTRSVVCPFELQQFSSSCHHKRELLSPRTLASWWHCSVRVYWFNTSGSMCADLYVWVLLPVLVVYIKQTPIARTFTLIVIGKSTNNMRWRQ